MKNKIKFEPIGFAPVYAQQPEGKPLNKNYDVQNKLTNTIDKKLGDEKYTPNKAEQDHILAQQYLNKHYPAEKQAQDNKYPLIGHYPW